MAARRKVTGADERHVALLRGINLGGRHSLPMAELRAMFAANGAADVATYIQSGNVAFRASGIRRAREIGEAVAAAIAAERGFAAPVVVRSAGEIEGVVRGNPFIAARVDAAELHVAFLSARPTADRVKRLDPARSPHDALVAAGSEIYLRLTKGVSGSKLTNDYLDRTLGVVSTSRNWRTVGKLAEMVGVSAAG